MLEVEIREQEVREKFARYMDDFAARYNVPARLIRLITMEQIYRAWAAHPTLPLLWAEMELAGKTDTPEDFMGYRVSRAEWGDPELRGAAEQTLERLYARMEQGLQN